MKRLLRSVGLWPALSLVVVLLSATMSYAQVDSARVSGRVADPTDAAVPDALCKITNVETNASFSTVTNAQGIYVFPELSPPGTYRLVVSKAGFETVIKAALELHMQDAIEANFVLSVGSTSQNITIAAAVPLVQTTTSSVQTTVTVRQMTELPLNGRNMFQLAVLTPGTTDTDAGTVPGQNENSGLAANGMRPTDTNWTLDGGTYVNKQSGTAPTLPNPDTVEEFTALTSNFSAEFFGGGPAITITTRSGTNQMHGTVFEFLRNTALDTRNFFSLGTEDYKQNQYGGTLGGPIRKNKLFYFGSFQGLNKRGNPSPNTITVPSVLQHSGDFTDTGKTIIDPSTNAPFPGNVIPKARWDSIGTKLLSYFPLPNRGKNTLVLPPSSNKDDYQWMGKIDYVIDQNDHLSGRYFLDRNHFQRDNASLPGMYGANLFDNQSALVRETHTFGPAWVMENSFSYLRTFRSEDPVGPLPTMQDLGAQVQPAMSGVPNKINVNVSGYLRVWTPRGIHFNPETLEYNGSTSHMLGTHFIRFGGNLHHNHNYNLNYSDELGAWTFNVTQTSSASVKNSGDAIASMLLGLPSNFTQATTVPFVFSNTVLGLWMQDDWKATRRLTLNLGVREDPWIPAGAGDNLLVGWVPGMQSQLAPLAPKGLVFGGDPGIPDAVFHNHWLQLAPRVGFAWAITGDNRTVLRGGYGIYRMGSEVFGLTRIWASNAPGTGASVSISSPPSTANPYAGYAGTIPFPSTPLTKSGLGSYVFPANSTLYAFDPTMKPGYVQSWNLTLERQVTSDTAITFAYVANHFIRALAATLANTAVYVPGASTTAAANENARRPYQGIGEINIVNAYNHGTYNGLQISVTKRPAKGLVLLGNYTFSKALDLNSASMLGGALGLTPRDPYNANLDKGPADFDTTHSFKLAAIYDIPGIAGAKGLVRALINGWQINGIMTARTGFPFTCQSGVDNSLTGVGHDDCDQVLPNTARPAGADPMQMFFNTAAFTANALGTYGTAGRNSLRRPNLVNADIAAFKRFQLTERFLMEFRVEAFNALNHPNFDLFYTPTAYTDSETVSSPTFGQITHARDPRLIQVSLKLRF